MNAIKATFGLERISCAYFFAYMGMMYGIFTARLPALKAMVNANDAQIGFLLLAFGGASFIGLLGSAKLMRHVGTRMTMAASVVISSLAMTIASLALSYWQLLGFCLVAGFCGGLCDVAMNTQGIVIEMRHKTLCMSFLHACFSLGGVLGSLSGSLFAALNMAPVYNFVAIFLLFGCIFPFALRYIITSFMPQPDKDAIRQPLPLLVYFCGLMSMCCYVSEGSVGEWGSILLHSEKGASQEQAALVFGCFCTSMVICRFSGDALRRKFREFTIVLTGSLLAALAMTIVLLSPWPILCLAGYTLMGFGFAPLVPIFYSAAGRIPGIAPAAASSAVSLLSYTGLLVFPPVLGLMGERIGLNNALWLIVAACICVCLGSFALKRS